ncbi:unnamed protein product [Urochloa humidicola]
MPSRSRGAGLFTLRWRRQGWFSSGAAHWPRIVDILVPRVSFPFPTCLIPGRLFPPARPALLAGRRLRILCRPPALLDMELMLLGDDEFAFHIIDDVPEVYEVPADKAAVPVNHALGGEFGTVGSLINSMLAIKKDERDKGIDRAAELKVVKESIEGMYANVQAMLEEAGEIPQVIMAAFDHLSIQWGPEEEENGAEDAAEEV